MTDRYKALTKRADNLMTEFENELRHLECLGTAEDFANFSIELEYVVEQSRYLQEQMWKHLLEIMEHNKHDCTALALPNYAVVAPKEDVELEETNGHTKAE